MRSRTVVCCGASIVVVVVVCKRKNNYDQHLDYISLIARAATFTRKVPGHYSHFCSSKRGNCTSTAQMTSMDQVG